MTIRKLNFSGVSLLLILVTIASLTVSGCNLTKQEPTPTTCSSDLDKDNICDNEDTDIDGDLVENTKDPFNNDRFKCGDSDGDGCDDCEISGYFDPNNDGCSPTKEEEEEEVVILEYNTHVRGQGWLSFVTQPSVSGVIGRKVEAVMIRVSSQSNRSIKIRYKAWLQNTGDTGWVEIPSYVGTVNQRRRMEAIWIEIKEAKDKADYSIMYQVYMESRGWGPWQRDGEMAGTIDEGRAIEAIRIKLEKR